MQRVEETINSTGTINKLIKITNFLTNFIIKLKTLWVGNGVFP